MKALIIGVSGKAGHGKDSVCNLIGKEILTHTMGGVFRFADKLKEICSHVFDIPMHNLTDEEGKDEPIAHLGGITGRFVLQQFGTDVARNIYSDIWVYHYRKEVEKYLVTYGKGQTKILVLTPDMRFPNEYDCIHNMFKEIAPVAETSSKSMLIRVVRPNHEMNGNNKHESETALDHYNDWDYVLIAKNMAQLEHATRPLISEIKEYFEL